MRRSIVTGVWGKFPLLGVLAGIALSFMPWSESVVGNQVQAPLQATGEGSLAISEHPPQESSASFWSFPSREAMPSLQPWHYRSLWGLAGVIAGGWVAWRLAHRQPRKPALPEVDPFSTLDPDTDDNGLSAVNSSRGKS
ncbi:MAG: hypothetical protein NW237_13560 [Cyanobacteriota bacterium]|nr:hypothetical protein [Cyanobacteriota bacterium]